MKKGDKIIQELHPTGEKKKGKVVSINRRHRHYTLEFTLPPTALRLHTAKVRETYKY